MTGSAGVPPAKAALARGDQLPALVANGVKSPSRKAGSTLAPMIMYGEKIRPLSARG